MHVYMHECRLSRGNLECLILIMKDWKAPLSLRVRQDLRAAIESAFYAVEKSPDVKSPSAFVEQLLEFAWVHYKKAGSLKKLLSPDLRNLERSLANDVDDMVFNTPSAQDRAPEPRQIHDSVRSNLRKSTETRIELRKRAHASTNQGDKKSKTGTD